MKQMQCLFLFLIILLPVVVSGQDNTQKKKIETLLERVKQHTHPDSILRYANDALYSIDTTKSIHPFIELLLIKSDAHKKKNELEEARHYSLRAYNKAEKEKILSLLGKSTTQIGHSAWESADYSTAKKWYYTSVENYHRTHDSVNICDAYIGLGNVFNVSAQIDSALHYYNLSIAAAKHSPEHQGQIITVLTNIGGLHLRYGKDHNRCIKFTKQAIELAEKHTLPAKEITALNVLGAAYMNSKQEEKAIPVFRNAIKLNIGISAKSNFYSHNNLGIIYKRKKQYNLAIKSYQRSLAFIEKDSYKYAISKGNMANIFKEQGLIDSALVYLNYAYSIIMNDKNISQKIALNTALSKTYLLANNPTKAYRYLAIASDIKDTLFIKERAVLLEESHAKYETRLKSDSISLQRAQLGLVQQIATQQRSYKYFFIILAGLLAGISWLLWKQYQVTQDEFQRIETENKLLISKNSSLLSDMTQANESKQSSDFMFNNYIILSNQKVQLSEIIHLSSEGKIVNVHTKNQSIRYYGSLKGLLKALPPHFFVQIHKSHIINLLEIQSQFGQRVIMANNMEIPIGRMHKKEFFQQIKKTATYI